MIAGPSHKYFRILSRTPELPGEELERLLQIARDAGFNLENLIRVTHQIAASTDHGQR
jgi:lipocalin